MNNKCKFLIVLSLIFMIATLPVQAEKVKGAIVKTTPKGSAECKAPSKLETLELNNVRTVLKTNGTMWYDGENAKYEVPKGSGKMSLYSAALWIGAEDNAGQLYVAAMRFGQVGNDYFTGPLTMKDAAINPVTCSDYDKFYRISRLEVEKHIHAFAENDANYISGGIPKSILEWPAVSKTASGQSIYLAPFCKNSSSSELVYDPKNGDYPYYDLENKLCPWTLENRKKAMECPWHNENGKCDPMGKKWNSAGLPMPKEREWTREEYGWDNKMIAADHVLKGDETLFWFLNDRGGHHGESHSANSIGLEIRVQAFAFATNDELNKMTFYSYEIINRGDKPLKNAFFSQWADPDLGYARDDYVGCDVNRGLGYCYNGKEIDGSGEAWAYGANPPAVGIDFFQGPYIDPDGVDNPKFYKDFADINGNEDQIEYCKRFVDYVVRLNDPNSSGMYVVTNKDGSKDTLYYNNQFAINGVNFGDSIVDNERFGMRRFVYHNNGSGPTTDPVYAQDYYNLLRGIWIDGKPMTYGGRAYDSPTGLVCDFMFPGNTDYCNWGTKGETQGKIPERFHFGGRTGNWSEEHPDGDDSKPNAPADRRFMHSAGPFSLGQGACNYITVGVPWARAQQGGVQASLQLLMVADDKCQALFENCFKLLDGPDAPELTIREYDKKLILLLSNSPLSNNANENYKETDSQIPQNRIDVITKDTIWYDRQYRFEGYQIYQVTGPEVGANDLDNPSLARLIRQYDIVNFDKEGSPIGTLINWEFDDAVQTIVPRLKVVGTNSGIEHSFEVTQDVFATGNKTLVNYKTYYFIAIAYAYNNFLQFSIEELYAPLGLTGQKCPYLRGRKTATGTSVIPIAAVPHPATVHGGVSTLNCDYGSIPNITRIDGQGNGGIALELTKQTKDYILKGGDNDTYRAQKLVYEKNAGPVKVMIIDPLRVKPFDYTLYIKDSTSTDVSDNAYWELRIDDNVSDDDLIKVGLIDKDKNPIRVFSSQTSIKDKHEEIIFPLGISVAIQNKPFVNTQKEVKRWWDRILSNYKNNEYRAKYIFNQPEKIDIEQDIVFANNGAQWIEGLESDNTIALPSNWIRAGSRTADIVYNDSNGATTTSVKRKYAKARLEDFFLETWMITEFPNTSIISARAFKDPSGKFGTLCKGTWAPYVLTSFFDFCPQANYITPEDNVHQQKYNNGTSTKKPVFEPFYYAFQAKENHNLDIPRPYNTTQAFATGDDQPGYNQTMTNLYSVDVVLTPNKNLWTRCIVLESCADSTRSEGRALKNEPRHALSIGKDYQPDGSTNGFYEGGKYGLSWFPGYAINLETGERLNVMFSENSDSLLNKYYSLVRGNDMIFNPTSTYAMTIKEYDTQGQGTLPPGYEISKFLYDNMYLNLNDWFAVADTGTQYLRNMGVERVWGGMHYIYVCGSSGNTSPMLYYQDFPNADAKRNFNLNDKIYKTFRTKPKGGVDSLAWGGYIDPETKQYPVYECGPYDESRWLIAKFKEMMAADNNNFHAIQNADYKATSISPLKRTKMQLFNNVMYTHIPLQPDNKELKAKWLSCDVTFKIRVARPYMRYISRWYESPDDRAYKDSIPNDLDQGGFPVYKLSTKNMTPTSNDTRLYQSVLDNINIVPNPYYGSSFYERNSLETMVKITNLPTDLKNGAPVTVNIYTVNGILVRTLTKGDSESAYINWDLKNYANIPVAGGVYIIHVNCPGIGERILKFFCTMRPTDLNQF